MCRGHERGVDRARRRRRERVGGGERAAAGRHAARNAARRAPGRAAGARSAPPVPRGGARAPPPLPLPQALASLARGTDLPPSLDVAGMLAKCLSKKFGVAECLDVLTAMAKTEEGARNLLAVPGLLDLVLEVQEGCKLDERMSSQCFIALAALAAHPSTSLLVASRPKAVRLAAEWIDDNMDLAGPAALCRAVTLMSNLAASPACRVQLMTEGFADIVKNVIQKTCVDAEAAAPEVLTASVVLLQVRAWRYAFPNARPMRLLNIRMRAASLRRNSRRRRRPSRSCTTLVC